MKVLLCGGGNAIHVLTAYISAKPNTHVTILSLFPGEADKLRDAIPNEGVRCVNDLGDDIIGKPDAVVDKVRFVCVYKYIFAHYDTYSSTLYYISSIHPYYYIG